MRLLVIHSGDEQIARWASEWDAEDVLVEFATDGAEALECVKAASFDAVVAAFPMQDWTAEEFTEEIARINGMIPVIIRDRAGSMADAVRLVKMGAYHFFGAEMDGRELTRAVENAVEYYRSRQLALLGASLECEPWRRLMVGQSEPMQNIAHIIRLVGARRCTVLITGETGSGKEIVARAVHMASNRSHLPMVAVNCHALPENLLEAELFGHVRGAFTGALNNRVGRFEQAHRSTIFLDEIGDMPLDLQAKLLRVLQEREFQRLGSSETVHVDVRVIAATNADLIERIRQGRFREDLYYRLNVVPMHVPPLRERLDDIPLLVHHFIAKICRQEDIPQKTAPAETLERLCRHNWPGNVRELENAVEMAIALSGDRKTLLAGDFPLPHAMSNRGFLSGPTPVITLPASGLDYEATVRRIERSILDQAMARTRGNKKRAADMLRLKRTTLAAKLRTLEAIAV
ncbi:MAG: sigma-54 dependent transcriptional regulator [Bryobacteraceae bacterium]